MLRDSLDGRGAWGRVDTFMCMAEPLRCLPEAITILLICYTQYKIKRFTKLQKLKVGLFAGVNFFHFLKVGRVLFNH